MITIDLDEVESCCGPARSEHAIYRYWQRREAASQRALTRALHENRVKEECLEIAMESLRWYASDEIIYRNADDALAEIKKRLAELEPEEKAHDDN